MNRYQLELKLQPNEDCDHEWSFTDCVSFASMRELCIREAFATDHHFRANRAYPRRMPRNMSNPFFDPLKLPTRLQTALQALYGHYEKTFKLWQDTGIRVPPCFIIVCQNTAISKLVYDFISGFHRKNEDGTTTLENGRLALFRNFDESTGNPLARPNTFGQSWMRCLGRTTSWHR